MTTRINEVPADRLTRTCDPDELGFETTDDVAPLEGTIGQERAVSALEMGLDIDASGFNLYISGNTGTGRSTALRAHVRASLAGSRYRRIGATSTTFRTLRNPSLFHCPAE